MMQSTLNTAYMHWLCQSVYYLSHTRAHTLSIKHVSSLRSFVLLRQLDGDLECAQKRRKLHLLRATEGQAMSVPTVSIALLFGT